MSTCRRVRRRADDGSVTAEIALGLPTLLIVVVLAVHVLTAVATATRTTDTAAFAARALGRGDPEPVVRRQVLAALPRADLTVSDLPQDGSAPARVVVTIRTRLRVPAALTAAVGSTRTVTGRAVAVDEASLAFAVRDETG